MTEETWGQVREELLRAVGKNNFSAWIDPISFDRMEGRTARFHVPTTFFGSWVSQNYGDVIRRNLAEIGALTPEQIRTQRHSRFMRMGRDL